jgi:hypothetical protein
VPRNDLAQTQQSCHQGSFGSVDGQPGLHVEFESAVRVHVLPDQRGQGAEIPCGDFSWPLRLRQNLLQHESVDVHHAILQQVQREHADFVILAAIADHFAAAGEEDEIVGTVPLLDDIEPLVYLAAELLAVKVAAEEDGFDRLAEFGEGFVGRMLNVAADEAA